MPTYPLFLNYYSDKLCCMFLRSKTRKKDGKQHRYWSVVENRRVSSGQVLQRQVLYLGEINGQQEAAWCQAIEVFDHDKNQPHQGQKPVEPESVVDSNYV